MPVTQRDVMHQIDEASFRIYQMQHLGLFINDLLSDCAPGAQANDVKYESLQVIFGMIGDEMEKARMDLGKAGNLLAQREAA